MCLRSAKELMELSSEIDEGFYIVLVTQIKRVTLLFSCLYDNPCPLNEER